ncbi:F420-dependent biliverdin reductase [Gordonia sinesedis]
MPLRSATSCSIAPDAAGQRTASPPTALTGTRYAGTMPRSTADLAAAALEFLSERHLGTFATTRADGTPHVAAVGFTFDPESGVARVITSDGNQKVRNVERDGYAALTQVDGRRWLTLEGPATVHRDRDRVADAERRYAQRFREPRVNPRRVVIEVDVSRVLGARTLLG